MSEYRLIRGDCLEILPILEVQSIDAVITDPPYLTRQSHVPIRGNSVGPVIEDTRSVGLPWGYSLAWIDAVARLEPKHWFVFCIGQMLSTLLPALEQHARFGEIFVWRKPNASPMARNVPRLDCELVVWMKHPKANNMRAREFRSLVIDVPFLQAGCFATERILAKHSGQAAHPTQKPVDIIWPFVQRFTEPGQTVLDPFAGTGTTGVVCVKENRNFIGIEIDPGYFAIAEKRISEAALQLPLLQP